MSQTYSYTELESYLDEALSPSEMAEVESALRDQPLLLQQLSAINGRRDAGLHSLGEIWRRHRVSCPTREQLGSFLLSALSSEWMKYTQFHLETIGCRLCTANLEDLRQRQQETSDHTASRRQKYFQSSAGYLQSKK